MNSVEDTAQTMFASQSVKNISQIILREVANITRYKMLYGNKSKSTNAEKISSDTNELLSNVKFTGQFTDIAYADTGMITEKAISELCNGDEKLFNNVYVKFSPRNLIVLNILIILDFSNCKDAYIVCWKTFYSIIFYGAVGVFKYIEI